MKKYRALKIFLKTLLFAAALLLAVLFFMPWKQVGEAVLLFGSGRLPEPASLAYSAVQDASGGFSVSNLEIRNLMGMVNISFGGLTIVPDVAASILGMTPTCRVEFTGAVIEDIAVTPLRKIPGIAPGNGRVIVSVSAQGIFLDGLRCEGELSMNGSMMADPSTQKIVWADVTMDVKSEAFEENLPVIASVSGLPLQQEGPGRWLLRRSSGSE